ncbi:MAG: hypothetical protein WCD81_02115 [Candidatus Bathyarchaeia archaeon]
MSSKTAIVAIDLDKILAVKRKRRDLEQKTASGVVDSLIQEELARA